LRCYIALALAWWAVTFAKGDAARNFTRLVVIVAAAMLAGFWWSHGIGLPHWPVFRLSWFFFCGAAFWVLRDRVPMRGWIAAALACAVAIGVRCPSLFFVVYPVALAYLVLWCAYVPGGWLRAYNRVGDYSYGVYIYAFAVQQAVIATWPGIGVAGRSSPPARSPGAGDGLMALDREAHAGAQGTRRDGLTLPRRWRRRGRRPRLVELLRLHQRPPTSSCRRRSRPLPSARETSPTATPSAATVLCSMRVAITWLLSLARTFATICTSAFGTLPPA
jgi:hypothetical protein